MSEEYSLNAELRTECGKAASRRLRRLAGRLPGIVYGGGENPAAVTLDFVEVMVGYNRGRFSQIVKLDLDGKLVSVVVKAIERHATKAEITHLDFLRVSSTEEITMSVGLVFNGAEDCLGVKAGGILQTSMTEIMIKCLPAALPQNIAVDIAALDIDHSIHLSEVVLPKGVVFVNDIEGDADLPVVAVQKAKAEKLPDDDAAVSETGEESAESAESTEAE